jgi:hypothetical protein
VDSCSKPGCSAAATVVLAYDYSARTALLLDPDPTSRSPHLYALCNRCAESLTAPRGWILDDRRVKPALWAGAP